MPNWNEVVYDIREVGSNYDIIRKKYLQELYNITGRNIILYYSGWLQKPNAPNIGINDNDKIGFMSTIQGLKRSEGLDLILHTPGGDTAATESIVDYLRQMFDGDIRAIVPQMAMSGGTMIACSCKSILMGKHSSLGPIDPQLGGIAAHGVVEEFNQAYEECKSDNAKIPIWQQIIAKYPPTFVGECQKAIDWSNEIVKEWLLTGMLKDCEDKNTTIKIIMDELGDHALTKSHSRHLSAIKCDDMGLSIEMIENDQQLQDAILTIHHACIYTLSTTSASKIIENQNGIKFIESVKM